jgi:uncharacterized protein YkwD/uncharacterized membrane protein required for colicin V production
MSIVGYLYSIIDSLTSLHLPILDIVVIGIILFYAYEGYQVGFFQSLLDLGGFLLAFIISLRVYSVVAIIFTSVFSLPAGIANAISFFITALVLEISLSILLRRLMRRLPYLPISDKLTHWFAKSDRVLGIVPGVLSAGIILSFLFSVLIALPSSPLLKQAITNSKVGSLLLSNTVGIEKYLHVIFGGAFQDSLAFFTVDPESTKNVELHFTVEHGTIDQESEKRMVLLVNAQRQEAGVEALQEDATLTKLARVYSDTLFKQGYFSHYDKNGNSPFDRMNDAHISYTYAGENLALAPSVDLAMQGLMNSPGHRANILKPQFKKIGIGVIDGGIYGKMFTQEFTD